MFLGPQFNGYTGSMVYAVKAVVLQNLKKSQAAEADLSLLSVGDGAQLQAHLCQLSPQLTAAAMAYSLPLALSDGSVHHYPGIEVVREEACMDEDDLPPLLVPWFDDEHPVTTVGSGVACAFSPSGAYLACVYQQTFGQGSDLELHFVSQVYVEQQRDWRHPVQQPLHQEGGARGWDISLETGVVFSSSEQLAAVRARQTGFSSEFGIRHKSCIIVFGVCHDFTQTFCVDGTGISLHWLPNTTSLLVCASQRVTIVHVSAGPSSPSELQPVWVPHDTTLWDPHTCCDALPSGQAFVKMHASHSWDKDDVSLELVAQSTQGLRKLSTTTASFPALSWIDDFISCVTCSVHASPHVTIAAWSVGGHEGRAFHEGGIIVFAMSGGHVLGQQPLYANSISRPLSLSSGGHFIALVSANEIHVLQSRDGACLLRMAPEDIWSQHADGLKVQPCHVAWHGPGCSQLHVTASVREVKGDTPTIADEDDESFPDESDKVFDVLFSVLQF